MAIVERNILLKTVPTVSDTVVASSKLFLNTKGRYMETWDPVNYIFLAVTRLQLKGYRVRIKRSLTS